MAHKKQRDVIAEVACEVAAADRLAADAEMARLRSDLASCRHRYKIALAQIDTERERADALQSLQGIKPATLTKSVKGQKRAKRRAKHAATAVLMLSDVHCEERVLPETVNGENDYSLDVCQLRLAEIEERFCDCLQHERNQADIDRVMVWLGGDFLTGHIHPDCVEVAQLSPMNATRWIAERLRGIVDRIAKAAGTVIVCTNAGNHGRSTEKNRIATELDGLALPASKAIARWDAGRKADLTIFGHYHSWGWLRGARYIANGSVIGHSPYAERVASPERPCQGMAIIDHGRNEVTRAYPLFCDRDLRKDDGK